MTYQNFSQPLRDYQLNSLKRLIELKKDNLHILFGAPTGSGKSLIMAHLIEKLSQKNLSILVVTPREILKTNIKKYIVSTDKIHFMNFTQRNYDNFSVDVVVFDEGHHNNCRSCQNIIKFYQPKTIYSFTATPDYINFKGYKNISIDCGKDIKQLIDDHHLCDFVCKSFCDKKQLKQIYQLRAKSSFSDKPLRQFALSIDDKYYSDIIDKLNSSSLWFFADKNHINKYLHLFPIDSTFVITAETPEQEREQYISLLKDKSKKVFILSIDTFSEGINIPSCDNIILARPTKSYRLFLQQLGRGLRYEQNKICSVYDLGGNFAYFGNPKTTGTLVNPYRLKAIQKNKKNMVKISFCPCCGAVIYSNREQTCWQCQTDLNVVRKVKALKRENYKLNLFHIYQKQLHRKQLDGIIQCPKLVKATVYYEPTQYIFLINSDGTSEIISANANEVIKINKKETTKKETEKHKLKQINYYINKYLNIDFKKVFKEFQCESDLYKVDRLYYDDSSFFDYIKPQIKTKVIDWFYSLFCCDLTIKNTTEQKKLLDKIDILKVTLEKNQVLFYHDGVSNPKKDNYFYSIFSNLTPTDNCYIDFPSQKKPWIQPIRFCMDNKLYDDKRFVENLEFKVKSFSLYINEQFQNYKINDTFITPTQLIQQISRFIRSNYGYILLEKVGDFFRINDVKVVE